MRTVFRFKCRVNRMGMTVFESNPIGERAYAPDHEYYKARPELLLPSGRFDSMNGLRGLRGMDPAWHWHICLSDGPGIEDALNDIDLLLEE